MDGPRQCKSGSSLSRIMVLSKDIAEPMQVEDCSLAFKERIIQISDGAQNINVSAHATSSAVILIEFHEKVIAALALSSDCGLLVTHLNERGGHIPTRYKNKAVSGSTYASR